MLSWQLLISAFGLGLLSSFHCVGMCGAIAFSLPVQNKTSAQKVVAILLYNFGRITVYSLFGLLFGLLGRQIYIAGLQQWFSIIAGILILVIMLQALFQFKFLSLPLFNKFNAGIKKIIGRLLRTPNVNVMFLLGMANGLLPCGFVYFAVTGALAVGSLQAAITFMFFFGLGTLPAMFSVSYFGTMIKLSVRQFIKKAVPFFMVVMGVLLVLRGMGLGIPYVSPFIPAAPAQVISCH